MRYTGILLALFFLFFNPELQAQQGTPNEETGLVNWLTFEEAFKLNEKQPKPFIIDFYTNWCGWCKHMMKTTYSHPGLASYINANFYPVKFNAETKDTVEYLGTKYYNTGSGSRSTHQLAVKLLGQRISYPSTVFMNNNFQFSLLAGGYLEIKKIEPLLIYTLENIFRTTAYEKFEEQYKKAFPDTPVDDTISNKLKWYSLNEVMELNKKEPKKTIVFIYTNWCNGCKIMNTTTFSDPRIKDYINKNYYLVDFNAEAKDTITYLGQTYINNGSNGPFHQLATALSRGNLTLPSTVILNESTSPIDVLPHYLSPEAMEPILLFFGNNSYKTMKWDEFLQNFKQ